MGKDAKYLGRLTDAERHTLWQFTTADARVKRKRLSPILNSVKHK